LRSGARRSAGIAHPPVGLRARVAAHARAILGKLTLRSLGTVLRTRPQFGRTALRHAVHAVQPAPRQPRRNTIPARFFFLAVG
jgi:hypothetical protein